MTFDAKTLTADQQATLSAELAVRGIKFLPAQAVRRVVDPKGSATLKVLGSTRRDKARREANRAAAQKQAAAAAAAPVKAAAPAKAATAAKK